MRLLRLPLTIKRYDSKIAFDRKKKLQDAADFESRLVYTHKIDQTTGYKLNLNASVINDDTISSISRSSSNSTLLDQPTSIVRNKKNTDGYRSDDSDDYVTGKAIRKSKKCLSVLSLNQQDCIQLESSLMRRARLTAGPNSLVYLLSDPRFVLPAEADEEKPIPIKVIEIIECGRFWMQINDEKHTKTLQLIHNTLNSRAYQIRTMETRNIHQDALCCAYYTDPNLGRCLYRARVIYANLTEKRADILFVDYGNKVNGIKFDDLYEITDNDLKTFPFQAVQCKLNNIKPSIIKNPNCTWNKKSTDAFLSVCSDQKEHKSFEIKVIEIEENGLTMVNLFGNSRLGSNDIGELLVDSGYAEHLNEVDISLNINKPKENDDLRYVPIMKSDYCPKPAQYENSFNFDMRNTSFRHNGELVYI
jgi:hypothetical protein